MKQSHRKFRSPFGLIRLRYQKRKRTLIYEQKGGSQSSSDRNGTSLDAHIHALYGLALQHPGKRILLIGCGGGTLATMLARAGCRVSLVDVDPASFRVAKRYFRLPASVTCHVADGLAFLQKTRRRYDTLILDAFIGENIPTHMTGPTFFKAALRCLRRSGIVLVNVCVDGKSDRTADRIAAEFKSRRRATRILDSAGTERNTIVLAGNVRHLRRPKLMLQAEADARQTKRELKAMHFRRARAVAIANPCGRRKSRK
jgi:spermidine synthase